MHVLTIAVAAILSNNTLRRLLINQAKVFICSVAPPFTLMASSRAGFRLMRSQKFQEVRTIYITKLTLTQANHCVRPATTCCTSPGSTSTP